MAGGFLTGCNDSSIHYQLFQSSIQSSDCFFGILNKIKCGWFAPLMTVNWLNCGLWAKCLRGVIQCHFEVWETTINIFNWENNWQTNQQWKPSLSMQYEFIFIDNTLFHLTREIHNIFLQYVLAQYSFDPNGLQIKILQFFIDNYESSSTPEPLTILTVVHTSCTWWKLGRRTSVGVRLTPVEGEGETWTFTSCLRVLLSTQEDGLPCVATSLETPPVCNQCGLRIKYILACWVEYRTYKHG